MAMIIVEVPDTSKATVLARIQAIKGVLSLRIFTEEKITPAEKEADIDEKSALNMANAIRPLPSQNMRNELLRIFASRLDTLYDAMSPGDVDHSLRNAIAGLSKSLSRAGFTLDDFAHRSRTYFPNGSYKSTQYNLTPLGRAALRLLQKES